MTKYFTKEGDDYKEVEAFSQEQIDDIVGNTRWLNERLERERGKFSDYDDLKTKADSVETIKTEYEDKLTEAATKNSDLEAKLKTANLATDKVKLVNEFKLSDDLAEFVTGDTVEDMRKRAEKLAKGIKPTGVDIDKKDKPENQKTDSARIASNLFGKKSDD